MGQQHEFRDPLPITTSIGCIRVRTASVTVTATGFSRTWEGVTRYYRSLVTTTSYAGVVKDNPSPTPDTSYTVTPAVATDEVSRGWDVVTVVQGDATYDLDAAPTSDFVPEEWTPALAGSPTWGAATVTETQTSYTETRSGTGAWSGTKTVATVWSDEITLAELVAAAESARDDVAFGPGEFEIRTGNSVGGLEFIADQDGGSVSLKIAEYSLGAYAGRASIAACELVGGTLNYEDPATPQLVRFSTDLTEVVDVPVGGFFGQDSFRDDEKQLFGGWRRVDLHQLYPSAQVITGSAALIPLSGHVFVTETTGTTLTDSGWALLGGFGGSLDPQEFLWSAGPA